MYCDYEALEDYATALNRTFNSMIKSVNSIEDSFKTATSTNAWDSITRDCLIDMCKTLYSDFDAINDKFANINQYLDSVVSNYRAFDKF